MEAASDSAFKTYLGKKKKALNAVSPEGEHTDDRKQALYIAVIGPVLSCVVTFPDGNTLYQRLHGASSSAYSGVPPEEPEYLPFSNSIRAAARAAIDFQRVCFRW